MQVWEHLVGDVEKRPAKQRSNGGRNHPAVAVVAMSAGVIALELANDSSITTGSARLDAPQP